MAEERRNGKRDREGPQNQKDKRQHGRPVRPLTVGREQKHTETKRSGLQLLAFDEGQARVYIHRAEIE